MRAFIAVVSGFCLAVWCLLAGASLKVTGELVAVAECEAYLSFRKQTNPGGIRLKPGVSYSVIEANKAVASWYRLYVEGARPAQRWVNARCGTVSIQTRSKSDVAKVGPCNTPGLADSFKLALSWHPAFCETKPNKPECKADDDRLYRAQNFTLHGLWPNKKECGIRYGFCGEIRRVIRPFCDYPKLKLSVQTRMRLNSIMPSASEGSCLQRHEWFKHGVCETNWDVNHYYEISIRLTREFNESGIAHWMRANVGRLVATSDFFSQVDKALGPGAHKRLQLKCSKGNLVDVYINLPSTLDQTRPLAQLVAQADEAPGNGCGGRFYIDRIGVGR